MPIALWLSLVISANGAPCALKPVDSVVATDREIRVGDVVEMDCVEAKQRERIAALTIAVLPPRKAQIELERSTVKALVRRRVPGLDLQPEPTDAETLTLEGPAPSPQAVAATCHRALRVIPAGRIIVAGDLESTICEHAAPASMLSFDRTHRVVRAAREIASGDFVGRLSAPLTAYDASEPVSIAVAVGPVRIERTAEVVQPGIGGRDVFVRDSEGAIFAVPTLTDKNGIE